ncbi:hypothetical protein ACIQFZ_42225 [Streptomyces sp. NPDC093064]|uniref:methyltransferase family protein n=2 Tax=Streptomyces TaxID=1883 RepID=UPI00383048EE
MTPGVTTPADFEAGDTPAPELNVRPLVDTTLLPDWRGAGKVVHSAHRVYEHLISLWAPGVIEAAHDLSVFAELSTGPKTGDQLARACAANPRAMRVLMDGLYAYDIVDRVPAGSRTSSTSSSTCSRPRPERPRAPVCVPKRDRWHKGRLVVTKIRSVRVASVMAPSALMSRSVGRAARELRCFCSQDGLDITEQ